MNKHHFIFTPGLWIGEGRVTFSGSPELLRFYTKWTVESEKNHIISCKQQVEMEGRDEDLFNTLVFSDIHPNSFLIELTSNQLGTVMGKGIVDQSIIAWEFRGYAEFEGFEIYDLQENGDYMLHAEFAASDQLRTIIDGRIWKKS